MKKLLLLLLAPVLLLAQVEVDTVIRLPAFIMNGLFSPELNKLYLVGWYEHEVLDCSTYQVHARIPRSYDNSYGYTSWNWRRKKLYVGFNPAPDSLVVIDMAANTLVITIAGSGMGSAYVASTDRLYRGTGGGLVALDCATDTVVRTIPPPVPGYTFYCPSWDSVGNKLYASIGGWGLPPKIAVYDCATDSLLTVIDIPAPYRTHGLHFDHVYRKAYYSVDGMSGRAGVIDTEADTVLRTLPLQSVQLFNTGIALDTKDHKAYILGPDSLGHGSALYVVDCATDSIVKKIVFPQKPWPVDLVRWVPWSNRVYLSRMGASPGQGIGTIVVDCNTDSIIVPNLVLGYWPPHDFQMDPIRQRVFAIGCESTLVHVLRDVEAGVAEEPAPRPAATATARFCPSSSGVLVEYQLPAAARVRATLHDAVGRRIGTQDAGEQKAGLHQLSWNRDQEGRRLSAGTYFVHLDMGTEQARLKAVVR
jgi:hypothetical protein